MPGDEDTPIVVSDPFARHLMTQYIERRQKELKVLNASLAKEDFSAIVQTAHKLYGSGAAYGLDEITRLGGELEEAAESRNSAQVAVLISELENFVRRLNLA
jgi:HPt (histidine-containing phosphotransfer) domain-containing protein